MRCAGGVSKGDLKRFLHWGAQHLGYPELANVVAAPPTAELEPLREGSAAPTDEQDMGMTYEVGRSAVTTAEHACSMHLRLGQSAGF